MQEAGVDEQAGPARPAGLRPGAGDGAGGGTGAGGGRPVLVVGAGLSGLVAARQLRDAGFAVVVVDKAHAPGGRMATRSVGGARLDTGAQFFTVRSERLSTMVDRWLADGLVYEWCRGFSEPADGHPRYAVRGGMQELPAVLAEGLDIRPSVQVRAVAEGPERGWVVDGAIADAVVLTPPAPQARALLDAGKVSLDPGVADAVDRITYEPVLSPLLVLDGPSGVPPPGAAQLTEGPFTFVADNATKGVSDAPALTLHVSGEVSAARYDEPDDELLADLTQAAAHAGWLGQARVVEAQLKRWRYSRPLEVHPVPCLVAVDGPFPLVLAGDAYGGPKVEGAILSGLAAADAVQHRLG